jgi:hypothetical protein
VIKTTNFGSSWTDISAGLPSVPANDLFVDPLNSNHLYAANDFGVYWTSDGGASWIKLNNGMPFVPVMDFSFYDNGGTRCLRAATHGRGVYELNIDGSLPVELTRFTAEYKPGSVDLEWMTATEVENFGFEIEKSINGREFKKIGFVPGSGNSNAPKFYKYKDMPSNGAIRYRLKQIDLDGSFSYSDIISVDIKIAENFILYQNYPNPFNPVTSIKYFVPDPGKVFIEIFNILGQKVDQTITLDREEGYHEFIWNAEEMPSGIYFYQITYVKSGAERSVSFTKKMILAK